MRDFQKLKEEVFRRSEKRISKIRKMKTVAVSLCICTCILCGVSFLKTPDIDSTQNDAGFGTITGGTVLNDGGEYTFLCDGECREIVLSAFESINFNDTDKGNERKESYTSTLFGGVSTYILTVENEDGTTVTYQLKGNVLTNVSTNEKVALSYESLCKLKEQLEINDTYKED